MRDAEGYDYRVHGDVYILDHLDLGVQPLSRPYCKRVCALGSGRETQRNDPSHQFVVSRR
jgi:hypothetical protein